jgi:Flp pilus assembly protein TadD
VVTFGVYLPSLGSGLVYDARKEILEEGFVTSLSNLPAVLSFQVLHMNIMLEDRPGQLLYMMLNAAAWRTEPWGYHLGSNLLHAANAGLLFVLLRRLVAGAGMGLEIESGRVRAALIGATLLFALHPLAVEPVAEISYCGDLLVTFFSLIALLAATAFPPDDRPRAALFGAIGAWCSFAAVTCKESGVVTPLLLAAYWFLFRRGERKVAWLVFLGAAAIPTALFVLTLRAASIATPSLPIGQLHFAPGSHDYLGGSFARVFLEQPRLWVFMMGKMVWPAGLSADYAPADIASPSTPLALVILVIVAGLQAWLAWKSPVGALGVGTYWLALATVSNFVPLFRVVADRFYYLALPGVAMQVLAVLLLLMRARHGFWPALTATLCALAPLTVLTIQRQAVFADDHALWTDTLRVSPHSQTAHLGLGWYDFQNGEADAALEEFRKAEAIDPGAAEVHYNLGVALAQSGRADEAVAEYRRAIQLRPEYAEAHYDLGNSLLAKGSADEAMREYRLALQANPRFYTAHNNLGTALLQAGQVDEAIAEFQQATAIDPDFADAHDNLGLAYAQKNEMQKAVGEFQEAVRLEPDDPGARNNLARAEDLLRQQK